MESFNILGKFFIDTHTTIKSGIYLEKLRYVENQVIRSDNEIVKLDQSDV